MRSHLPLAAVLATAVFGPAAAHAQSLNIDFNRTSGIGSGSPPSAFGGAANQFGWWNAVSPSSASNGAVYSLTGLGGAGSGGQSLHHKSSNPADSADYGSGDFEKLMGDYAFGFTQNGRVELNFNGLQPGFYTVYVYAGLPPSEATYTHNGQTLPHVQTIGIQVNNQPIASAQTSGIPSAPNTFEHGVNFVRLSAGIAEGDTLSIIANADLANSSAKVAVNGLQLVKWTSNRICVRPGGAGDQTGRDWANAMSDLQAAINAAASSHGAITEVWVAGGVYKPTTGSDRTRSFHLRDGVKVYGGFVGTETSLSQRILGPGAPVTSVLSGEIGNLLTTADNSYAVVRGQDLLGQAVLDGFTIAGGNANGPAPSAGNDPIHNGAGGIMLRNASPRFRNLRIVNNRGTTAGAVYILGQADGGGPAFGRCDFIGNHSDSQGGALRYDARTGWFLPTDTHLHACRMIGNNSGGSGSAIYSDDGQIYLVNSLIHGNTGAGAAIHVVSASTTLVGSTVSHNLANVGPGGAIVDDAPFIVMGSILWGNSGLLPIGPKPQARTSEPHFYQPFHSCIQLAANELPMPNAIALDPLFIDPDGPNNVRGDADDDLRLQPGSPCIDSGFGQSIADLADLDGDDDSIERLLIDLTGASRCHDDPAAPDAAYAPADSDCRHADMGCFEMTYTPACPADFNLSGSVSVQDIFDFLTAYFASSPPADINNSGSVTVQDIFDFLAAYFAGC